MGTDWMRDMQRAVRRCGGELPVDAFLPELEAGHLTSATPEIAGEPEPVVEALGVPFSEREETTVSRPRRSSPKPEEEQSPEDLEGEIREFMGRNKRGPAPDDDFSEFLGSGIDPNVDD